MNIFKLEREREREKQWLLNAVNEGDGLELLRSLKNEVAQLVIFDPQYKDTKNTAKHVNEHYYKLPHANQDEQNIKDFVKEIARVLKPSAFLLFWIDDLILIKSNFKQWISEPLKVIEILIWKKGKFVGLGINYFRKNCEYALLIQKEPLKKQVKDAGIVNVFSEIVDFAKRHNTHEKPYKMTKKIIKQLTNTEDLVVDPCAGSFVVMEACLATNRNFLGVDLTFNELQEREREQNLFLLMTK